MAPAAVIRKSKRRERSREIFAHSPIDSRRSSRLEPMNSNTKPHIPPQPLLLSINLKSFLQRPARTGDDFKSHPRPESSRFDLRIIGKESLATAGFDEGLQGGQEVAAETSSLVSGRDAEAADFPVCCAAFSVVRVGGGGVCDVLVALAALRVIYPAVAAVRHDTTASDGLSIIFQNDGQMPAVPELGDEALCGGLCGAG